MHPSRSEWLGLPTEARPRLGGPSSIDPNHGERAAFSADELGFELGLDSLTPKATKLAANGSGVSPTQPSIHCCAPRFLRAAPATSEESGLVQATQTL